MLCIFAKENLVIQSLALLHCRLTSCTRLNLCPAPRRGLPSGLGPIDDACYSTSVNGPSQVYHFSRRQRHWHLDAANQGASNGQIL